MPPSENPVLPAWSSAFTAQALQSLALNGPLKQIDREWAWGGSLGKGVKVAVVDSGIDASYPDLVGSVRGGISVEYDEQAENYIRFVDEAIPIDSAGHGTACAGIIHCLAPEAELYSVRVLGKDARGRAIQFAAGLDWAVDNGMDVVNLSLSTSKEEYYGLFHQITDSAYFKNVVLVSAANNNPVPSYPSLYSSVISVAAHEGHDPFSYFYNPAPPVEFGAPGIDIEVAWLDHQRLVATGNSFAAPHMAGIVTLIRAKHPELTPFQIKTVLVSCAANTHLDE